MFECVGKVTSDEKEEGGTDVEKKGNEIEGYFSSFHVFMLWIIPKSRVLYFTTLMLAADAIGPFHSSGG